MQEQQLSLLAPPTIVGTTSAERFFYLFLGLQIFRCHRDHNEVNNVSVVRGVTCLNIISFSTVVEHGIVTGENNTIDVWKRVKDVIQNFSIP